MTTITPDTTLAQIVDAHPDLAAALERLGLDYCCGGRRSVAVAARDRGLALDDVFAVLEREHTRGRRADWLDLGIADLVDHIETTHHAYLHAELPRLEALAEKVAGAHGDRHPELVDVLTLTVELRADLEPHLRREELVLFPMIRQLALAVESGQAPPLLQCGRLANPISVMLAEHEMTGTLLATLRETTGGHHVPDDGCASYRALYDGLAALEADTHLHVHKENNVLFPAVLAVEDAACRR